MRNNTSDGIASEDEAEDEEYLELWIVRFKGQGAKSEESFPLWVGNRELLVNSFKIHSFIGEAWHAQASSSFLPVNGTLSVN